MTDRPSHRMMVDPDGMELDFTGDIWHWRGPAPFYFVTVPREESGHLHAVSKTVSYGWGMIPVRARIGDTKWETALFPKDGLYVLPVKDAVRRTQQIDEGDIVAVQLTVPGPS